MAASSVSVLALPRSHDYALVVDPSRFARADGSRVPTRAPVQGVTCYWGVLPGTHKGEGVQNPDGSFTYEEELPDKSTFQFTTPKPPEWAKDDPELWKVTKAEQIHTKRQEAFRAHWESRTEEKTRELEILKDSFRIFDKDNSGCIDANEVLEILTRVGGGNPMTQDDAKEFIKMFDQNGDGKMQASALKSDTGRWLSARPVIA